MSLSSHDGKEDDKEYHDKRAEIRRHLPELEGRLQEMRKYKRSFSALLNPANWLHTSACSFNTASLTFPSAGSNGEEGSPVFCALSELRRQVLFPSTATRVPLHVLLRGEDLLRREVPSLKSKDATSECLLIRSWRNRYKKRFSLFPLCRLHRRRRLEVQRLPRRGGEEATGRCCCCCCFVSLGF